MNFDQGHFNFDAKDPADGYRKWREEIDSKKRAFESRWGVILSRRVRVQLKEYAKPLSGVLVWVDSGKTKSNGLPRFRLRGLEFGVGEIESIVQEDTE